MERAAADTDRDAAALKFTVLSQFHLSSLELPVGCLLYTSLGDGLRDALDPKLTD